MYKLIKYRKNKMIYNKELANLLSPNNNHKSLSNLIKIQIITSNKTQLINS